MRLRVWTWSSIRVGFLCYRYELFTLFLLTIYAICAKKQNRALWLASHEGIRCLTRGLTDARGEV
jgi:hypothetical protein